MVYLLSLPSNKFLFRQAEMERLNFPIRVTMHAILCYVSTTCTLAPRRL